MLGMLRKLGLTSNMMYGAGFVSIGLSFGSWALSRKAEKADLDRADRWGIFVGEWAPTFMARGVGLRLEEEREIAPGAATAGVLEEVGASDGAVRSPAVDARSARK